jgi:WD40 repeat protein
MCMGSSGIDKVSNYLPFKRGKLVAKYEKHSAAITCLKMFKGLLLSSSADKTVKVWNTTTMEIINTMEGHAAPVTSISILTYWRFNVGNIEHRL